MSNKCRVYVALQHRGQLSLGQNRLEQQCNAYHWGILISPKISKGHDCLALDATDAADLDPNTCVDRNHNHDWRFRSRTLDPLESGHWQGPDREGTQ